MKDLFLELLDRLSEAQLAVLAALLLGGLLLAALLLLPRWFSTSPAAVARKLGWILAVPGAAGLLLLVAVLAGWLELGGSREGGFAVGALFVLVVWPAILLVLPASLLLLAFGHGLRPLHALRRLVAPGPPPRPLALGAAGLALLLLAAEALAELALGDGGARGRALVLAAALLGLASAWPAIRGMAAGKLGFALTMLPYLAWGGGEDLPSYLGSVLPRLQEDPALRAGWGGAMFQAAAWIHQLGRWLGPAAAVALWIPPPRERVRLVAHEPPGAGEQAPPR